MNRRKLRLALLIALPLAVLFGVAAYALALHLLKQQITRALGESGEVREIHVSLREVDIDGLRIKASRPGWPAEDELRATLHQVLATAGLAPETLSADRYVRLLNTLLNWAPAASWRDRIVPECDPQRLIRDQLLDYDVAVEVDARGQTSVPGVFAAGDATTTPYKQIVIAMGEGAKASLSAFDHLIRSSAPVAQPEKLAA